MLDQKINKIDNKNLTREMPNKKHEDIHAKKEKEPNKGQPVGQNIHENIHSGNTPQGKNKKNLGIKPAGLHQGPINN